MWSLDIFSDTYANSLNILYSQFQMPPTLAEKYWSYLLKFWNFTNESAYLCNHILSEEELFTITPEQIYAYCGHKVYGKTNPTADNNPTLGRSSNIEFVKKALSFFMPNRLATWDVGTKRGNLTKSALLNDLIKTVKRKEVRKQGVKSSARRPMEISEFGQVIKRLRQRREQFSEYSSSAYLIF